MRHIKSAHPVWRGAALHRLFMLLPAALVAGLFSATSATAMSMDAYIADVVRSHPEISQHIHHHREVLQDLEISRKGWRPTVDLDASAGAFSTKSPITNQLKRNYQGNQTSLTITQNLFDGLDTTNQLEQNEARISSALFRIYDETDNIALDAINAYIEALKQRRLVTLAESNVKSHQQIYTQIRNRLDSGMGRRSDAEQTEGRLARAHASLIAQQNNLQDRLTQLHKYLGRYISADALMEPESPYISDGSLDDLIDLALGWHPALRVARFNVQAAEADHSRAKSGYLPRVDLQLQGLAGENIGGYSGPTNEYRAQILLHYNLYNGGADRAEELKRISTIHQNSEYERNVRRQVIEALRLAWMARETLEKQLSSLDKYVDQARKTSLSYREEFLLGQRDLTDLLDAESELNVAEKSQAEASYDLLMASFRIHEATGNLFTALGLDVAITKDGISALQVDRNRTDSLPVTADRDTDNKIDASDHCDNTKQPSAINAYGCIALPELQLSTPVAQEPSDVVPAPDETPAPAEQEDADIAPLPEIHTDGTPVIEHLNFIYKSTELTPESKQRLEQIVAALNAIPEATIEVYAYTDAIGGKAYNIELSERRANAIRDHLIDGGLDASRISATGMGEASPIADNETDEGRALNRRVEFVITREIPEAVMDVISPEEAQNPDESARQSPADNQP